MSPYENKDQQTRSMFLPAGAVVCLVVVTCCLRVRSPHCHIGSSSVVLASIRSGTGVRSGYCELGTIWRTTATSN